MIEMMRAAQAWAALPVSQRSELLFGLRVAATSAARSPLKVQQAFGESNQRAIDLLYAAGVALAKEDAQRTQPVAALASEKPALLAELPMSATERVLRDVAAERARQHAQWGEQELADVDRVAADRISAARVIRAELDEAVMAKLATWAMVLLEEVAEAVEAAQYSSTEHLRAELVQVAAVAVQWIEALDRRARARELARNLRSAEERGNQRFDEILSLQAKAVGP